MGHQANKMVFVYGIDMLFVSSAQYLSKGPSECPIPILNERTFIKDCAALSRIPPEPSLAIFNYLQSTKTKNILEKVLSNPNLLYPSKDIMKSSQFCLTVFPSPEIPVIFILSIISIPQSPMQRLQSLQSHLIKSPISAKSADDVVICAAVRTPVTKAKRGAFKDTAPEVMLAAALKEVVARAKLDPKLVDDIAVGNNLQSGAGEIPHRMAMFLAGFPDTTSIVTINRLCSSGLETCSIIAAKIQSGTIDIGIGSGVESMSLYEMGAWVDLEKLGKDTLQNTNANLCLMPMGMTSENVAEKYGITRAMQDQLAYESHLKAFKAQEAGLFKSEIVPVKTKIIDAKGVSKEIIVTEDDGIRKETTLQSLGKLKTVFKKDGTTTAGNSSQISDGAAAVLLARRSVAEKLNLPIIAKFSGYAVKGCPPELMGIGPAVAIPELLAKTGVKVAEVDIWEINEAFASQATYCVEKLGIDKTKVNPKGGAIALGHPLGCTGSRQIATLLPELLRTNGRYGVVSMCIGTGMGAAALIEREG